MNQNSKKLAKIAATLAGKPQVEAEILDEISKNALVSYLLSLRVSRGITQEAVAEGMGCDASKVSRIEAGDDASLKWVDVQGYVNALGWNMKLLFEDPTLPAAEQIKQCVYSIHEKLNALTDLAKELGAQDDISKKINEFSGEVLFNFLVRFQDHSERLKSVISLSQRKRVAAAAGSPGEVVSEQYMKQDINA